MKTVELTQGQVALVDDADYEAVSAHKRYAEKGRWGFYAARTICWPSGKKTNQYLHQFLMPGAPEVHHRDGNGLNNQRDNLRSVTHQQNLQGFQHKRLGASSSYRGVTWHKQRRKWQAQIEVDGHYIYLGVFADEADAVRARDTASLKYFGEHAQLNFL